VRPTFCSSYKKSISEVWQTPSYFRRAYIATATALVGGLQGFML
jgi:hypothetical protein